MILTYLNLGGLNFVLNVLYKSTVTIITSSVAKEIGNTMAIIITVLLSSSLSSPLLAMTLFICSLTHDSNTLFVGALHTL